MLESRGKSLKTNEWVFGHLLKTFDNDELRLFIVSDIKDPIFDREVVPSTVGLNTTLKDSLSHTIYTNDILVDERGKRWLVTFKNGCFVCELCDDRRFWIPLMYLLDAYKLTIEGVEE